MLGKYCGGGRRLPEKGGCLMKQCLVYSQQYSNTIDKHLSQPVM